MRWPTAALAAALAVAGTTRADEPLLIRHIPLKDVTENLYFPMQSWNKLCYFKDGYSTAPPVDVDTLIGVNDDLECTKYAVDATDLLGSSLLSVSGQPYSLEADNFLDPDTHIVGIETTDPEKYHFYLWRNGRTINHRSESTPPEHVMDYGDDKWFWTIDYEEDAFSHTVQTGKAVLNSNTDEWTLTHQASTECPNGIHRAVTNAGTVQAGLINTAIVGLNNAGFSYPLINTEGYTGYCLAPQTMTLKINTGTSDDLLKFNANPDNQNYYYYNDKLSDCPEENTMAAQLLDKRCYENDISDYEISVLKTTSQCPAGTSLKTFIFSDDGCAPCSAGEYASSAGTGTCAECDAGKFQTSVGASECSDCLPGSYQSNAGESQCTNCPAGTYLDTAGSAAASACKACPSGTYQNDAGRSACIETAEDCEESDNTWMVLAIVGFSLFLVSLTFAILKTFEPASSEISNKIAGLMF